MAILDSDMPVDMLSGFDFSSLNAGTLTSFSAYDLRVDQASGAYDWLFGYDMSVAVDDFGGLWASGTVTDYFSGWYGVPYLAVSGVQVPFVDLLNASLTYSLGDDAAVIRQAFAGNDTILGSDYADVLDGFDGSDTISAYAGDDLVFGEAGYDWVNGGAGNDSIYGGTGNDTVDGNIGYDWLSGDDGEDTIYGGADGDVIDGGYGNDWLSGDDGNDVAYGGLGNDNIAGGYGNDVAHGGLGIDTVAGGYGNDWVGGGAGKDTLRGGAGRDTFVFDAKANTANIDRIVDFNVRDDTIALDNAVMKVGSNGALSSGYFWKSTSGHAHDRSDRVIYETDTGWLNYDSNGSAAGGEVHLAKLAANLAMTARDFIVI